MRKGAASVPDLVAGARQGDARSVARLISMVEDESVLLREVTATLARNRRGGPGAHVVGLTGAPGVGKSTTTSALVTELRRRDRRVGVLAVDPSSPFSGGALLGDRIRMQEHDTDPGVYVRSMASRGHLGGLAWSTPQALRVLEAAGCDVIVIETVGVGQSEVEIASLADSSVVLLAPGMGDGIQTAKAGIVEIGDLFIVNKADREGAVQVARDLRAMIRLATRPAGGWTPPVLKASALSGDGIVEITDALAEHWAHLVGTGELEQRRVSRASAEIEAVAVAQLRSRWGNVGAGDELGVLAARVVRGETDPYAAAETLIEGSADGG